MSDKQTLGPWVRRFLMEHLPDDRNLSRNTQQSYRDALRLLIVFAAGKLRKKADRLLLADIDADHVRNFLRHIEEKRGLHHLHAQSTSARDAKEEDRPAHNPPHHCNSPASRWSGHQYHPRVARARLARHHQRIRRDRP